MEPSRHLADALYRECVLSARKVPPEEELLDCARIRGLARRIMMDGIRDQSPGGGSRTGCRSRHLGRPHVRPLLDVAGGVFGVGR